MADLISIILGSQFKADERFIMHRYYSTRLAMIVGMILIVVWFNYELLVNDHLRWDLVVIVGVMALTKIVAMLYYRITQ
jgi:low affinity Fe/Cu permease